ncbi:MAG TPA: hypothetical protein VK131_06175, partial [Candidatus Acidoferrales bacterium]|nr:hypothetical protein [Candidatus Acidoferrales bacterium]
MTEREPGIRDRRVDRMLPGLHPGRLHRRRGLVGLGLMAGLFLVFVALGLYVAGLHRGTAPTAQTLVVTVSGGKLVPDHLRVHEGDQVVLSITGDRSQTLLIKGYERRVTLIPGVAV